MRVEEGRTLQRRQRLSKDLKDGREKPRGCTGKGWSQQRKNKCKGPEVEGHTVYLRIRMAKTPVLLEEGE